MEFRMPIDVEKLFDVYTHLKIGDVGISINPNGLVNKLEELKMPYRISDLNGHTFFCVYTDIPGLEVFQKARQNSSSSEVFYIAQLVRENGGYLWQWAPEGAHSSRHYHDELIEVFRNLLKGCLLDVNTIPNCREGREGERILLNGAGYTVYPQTPHRIGANGSDSLNMLEMVGPWEGLSTADHHPI